MSIKTKNLHETSPTELLRKFCDNFNIININGNNNNKYYIFGLGMCSSITYIHKLLVKLRKMVQNLQEREQTPTDMLTHRQLVDLIKRFKKN